MSDMNDYYRLNIPNGEVKRILDSNNKVLWRRAIEKSTDGSSFEGTRNTTLKALNRYGKLTFIPTTTNTAITQTGKCVQSNLPAGFTQVSYIDSSTAVSSPTGGYVDTDLVFNTADLNIEVDFQFNSTPDQMTQSDLFGFSGMIGAVKFGARAMYNANVFGEVMIFDQELDTSRHTVAITTAIVNDSPVWSCSLDGVDVTGQQSLSSNFLSNTIRSFLFANNQDGMPSGKANCKIYSMKVTKAGVLIHNLVPAKNASNALGFYDTVDGTWLPATGTFTAGENVTPSPSTPVDILCNNGALRFGWHDIITTSQLSGYGTYVSPSSIAGTRAYKWLKDLPNGTYQISVDGDYELIVQWRDPADPSVLIASAYENLSGWMTSGEVVLDKEGGGYGIAVRRTSGTSSITPSNFDGTLHVQEQGLYVVGTPEVLTVTGGNLLDPSMSNITIGQIVNANGEIATAANNWRTDYIPVEGGKTYAFWGRTKADNTISAYNRINWYTAGKTAITPRPDYTRNTVTVGTAPSNAAYAMLSGAPINSSNPITRDTFDAFNWMFAEASAEIPYQPYVTPQTVTDFPMLLSVGDYKDEGKIIHGIKTGKVGVKVFDGTETVNVSSAGNAYIAIDGVAIGAPNTPINTHFALETSTTSLTEGRARFGANGSTIYSGNYYMSHPTNRTAESFKAWLASEYANGTPVIVLYPLATETTEQTTAYPQLQNKGYTAASVTAEVSDIQVTFTTGEQTVPTPYSPLPIVCNNGEMKWNGTAVVADGTPEVLTVSGANLLDPSAVIEDNKYIHSGNGNLTRPSATGGEFRYSGYILVKEGVKYFFGITPFSASAAGIAWYSTTDATGYISGVNGSMLQNENNNMKATAPVGAKYLRFCWRIDEGYDTDWGHSVYLCECDSNSDPIISAWQAYATPQTVTDVPMLLSVGGYADEAEIINGIKTGKLGVMVLDGTENFYVSTGDTYGVAIDKNKYPGSYVDAVPILCTHLPFSTSSSTSQTDVICNRSGNYGIRFLFDETIMALADTKVAAAKVFISAEYAKGTPIMVVYVRATETTEQTTPHNIQQSIGINTVSTSTEVNGGHNITYYGE